MSSAASSSAPSSAAASSGASDAPLMLSVSGARGIVGATMTPAVAATFAAAWGSHVRQHAGDAHGRHPAVVLGRDSRPSGAMLADAARAGLLSVGCTPIDLGVVTTPTAGIMVGHLGAAAGLVITASHNPTPWNGLKCIDGTGVAPPADHARAVIERFQAGRTDMVPATDIPAARTDDRGHQVHVDRVLELVDVDAIRAKAFRVVLDSVNGAGCVPGRMLLEALGCELVQLNGEPTGHFAHPPEPIREHLGDLCDAVRTHGAVAGFAQDPDADRLAIVDERGTYIGEEYTLVLAARQMLERFGPGVMAANLSTSRMLDDLAQQRGAPAVVRSAVGEANVADAMRQAADAAGTTPLVGGEGNGGVIVPRIGWVRDSLSAMALVLDALAGGVQTSDIVAEVPAYAMIKDKLDLAAVGGRAAIDPVLEQVRTTWPDGRVDDADGVRVDVADAWIHVRASNTEPILRIIAEAPDEAAARTMVDRVRAMLPSG